jgi:hypothetical protein
VRLIASVGAATVSPARATTGTDGSATFKVRDAAARQATAVTYRAEDLSDSVSVADAATVTFLPANAPYAPNSTITASSATQSRGTSSATITVMVANLDGNPVPGVEVTLKGAASARVLKLRVTTDSNGLASFTVTDTESQSVTFVAESTGSSALELGTVTVKFHAASTSSHVHTRSSRSKSRSKG